MEKKRSVGVTRYGVLLLFISFFNFVMGFGAAMSAGSPDTLLRLALVFTPIGLGISSAGLLLLKDWARYLFLISAPAMYFSFFWSLFEEIFKQKHLSEPISDYLIPLGYTVFIASAIYFFTRPKVKEQFK